MILGKYPLPMLPKNADELIKAEVATYKKEKYCDVSESERTVRYGSGQCFAVFGNTAYELLDFVMQTDRGLMGFSPAILNGVSYRMDPDEGRGGTLHWLYSRKFGWMLMWSGASGWIRTAELELSPKEIMDNIAEEIDAGQTPLTGFNSQERYK